MGGVEIFFPPPPAPAPAATEVCLGPSVLNMPFFVPTALPLNGEPAVVLVEVEVERAPGLKTGLSMDELSGAMGEPATPPPPPPPSTSFCFLLLLPVLGCLIFVVVEEAVAGLQAEVVAGGTGETT